MTPAKEKAEELYNKIYFRLPNSMSEISKRLYSKMFSEIMVDELINDDVFFKSINETREHSKFWNEVQSELNKK